MKLMISLELTCCQPKDIWEMSLYIQYVVHCSWIEILELINPVFGLSNANDHCKETMDDRLEIELKWQDTMEISLYALEHLNILLIELIGQNMESTSSQEQVNFKKPTDSTLEKFPTQRREGQSFKCFWNINFLWLKSLLRKSGTLYKGQLE